MHTALASSNICSPLLLRHCAEDDVHLLETAAFCLGNESARISFSDIKMEGLCIVNVQRKYGHRAEVDGAEDEEQLVSQL